MTVREDVERAFDKYGAAAVGAAAGAVLGRKLGKRVARRVTEGAKNASRKTHGDIRIRDDEHARKVSGLVDRAEKGRFDDKITRDYKSAVSRYRGGQIAGASAGTIGGAGAGAAAGEVLNRRRKK